MGFENSDTSWLLFLGLTIVLPVFLLYFVLLGTSLLVAKKPTKTKFKIKHIRDLTSLTIQDHWPYLLRWFGLAVLAAGWLLIIQFIFVGGPNRGMGSHIFNDPFNPYKDAHVSVFLILAGNLLAYVARVVIIDWNPKKLAKRVSIKQQATTLFKTYRVVLTVATVAVLFISGLFMVYGTFRQKPFQDESKRLDPLVEDMVLVRSKLTGTWFKAYNRCDPIAGGKYNCVVGVSLIEDLYPGYPSVQTVTKTLENAISQPAFKLKGDFYNGLVVAPDTTNIPKQTVHYIHSATGTGCTLTYSANQPSAASAPRYIYDFVCESTTTRAIF